MFLLIPNPLLTLRGNIYRINDHPVVEPDNRRGRPVRSVFAGEGASMHDP
jgi:hypothetical protein